MNIVLIGNYPADDSASMQRYATFLEQQLRVAGHEVRLVQPGVFAGKLLPHGNRLAKWLGYLDKYVFFRFGFAKKLVGAEIVHVCDHSNSVYLPWIDRGRSIITCHDALAIRSALNHYEVNPTGPTGKILQRWISKSLAHAERVIYVSEKTRNDFEGVLDLQVPSHVVHHALNWDYSTADDAEVERLLEELGLTREGYILHVGGNQWYKNRMGVLRMHTALRSNQRFQTMKLVMVGKAMTPQMKDWCRANGLRDVVEMINPGNDQLRLLYSGAFALLFPSLEEGFGWPVLEAQACGCPVLTSNRAPLTEIAGSGAIFLDPQEPTSVVNAAMQCARERQRLISAGFKNLAGFQVNDMISRYENIYREMIRRHP